MTTLQSRRESFALGFDPATKDVRWESRLPAPRDIAASPRRDERHVTAISGGRLFHVYRNDAGEKHYRAVVRSARTGALLHAVNLHRGRRLRDVDDVRRRRRLLRAGTDLVVMNAVSGEIRSLAAF